jgi:hypothetical protein
VWENENKANSAQLKLELELSLVTLMCSIVFSFIVVNLKIMD